MSVLVLTTCGTMGALAHEDPLHPPVFITPPPDGRDVVCEALAGPNFNFVETRCISLKPCDSKEINEQYRQNVLGIIARAPEKEILLTHGSDTILESAGWFHRKQSGGDPALQDKDILLTGSMTPLLNGKSSDGYLNLEFSLEKLKGFEAARSRGDRQKNGGVYIVLCDYEFPEIEGGAWSPKLYLYEPERYKKFYNRNDARRSRIVSIQQAQASLA